MVKLNHTNRSYAWIAVLGLVVIIVGLAPATEAHADPSHDHGHDHQPTRAEVVDPFRQLEEILPTPGGTRAGSGAPGHRYWQQRADYDIEVEIDEREHRLTGIETVRYENNSPHELRYLWLQLDANIYAPDAAAVLSTAASSLTRMPYRSLRMMLARERFDGSVKIRAVTDKRGRPLEHQVVGTMMRIDLPDPLPAGRKTDFKVSWTYLINPSDRVPGRTGYEHFDEDGNDIFEIAQWFPRMAAYTDVNGWQHKQFLGRGEFTLEFGDYDVEITVPEDHVVAATGELQNERQVLSKTQRDRLEQAESSKTPVFIVTPAEAKAAEKTRKKGKKTWKFRAKNVRDFAFATSRKFIWDAKQHPVGDNEVWAMSYYPNEGEPLWSRYSTHAIIHTLDAYSRYTFEYPYPVAISVNGPVGGMEYPMICFNGPRPEEDGTYSARTKYGLISVIIHEVGHNFFPMIVNSDERQWTWMDEGLNTFLQYLAEQEWEKDYPSRRGEPAKIVSYMLSEDSVPIMTNSESLLQFGSNAYAKPATALNILRETVLGRELFDYAFKEYARRWKFKHPMPADFFRSMEDASGVDLDWFWRGWFYSTQHVDIAITGVRKFRIDTKDPEIEKAWLRDRRDAEPVTQSKQRNAALPKRADAIPELKDFYNEYDDLEVTEADRKAYKKYLDGLEDKERALLTDKRNFYLLDFENRGGLVMPILLELKFADNSTQMLRIPAEIWRRSPRQVTKLVMSEAELVGVTVDPRLETADADTSNNHFPPRIEESRFELYKWESEENPMQRAKEAAEKADEPADDAETEDKKPEDKKPEDKKPEDKTDDGRTGTAAR